MLRKIQKNPLFKNFSVLNFMQFIAHFKAHCTNALVVKKLSYSFFTVILYTATILRLSKGPLHDSRLALRPLILGYLIRTYFRAYLISRFCRSHISRDFIFAILMAENDDDRLYLNTLNLFSKSWFTKEVWYKKILSMIRYQEDIIRWSQYIC